MKVNFRYLIYVFVQLLILLTNIVLKLSSGFFGVRPKKSIKMQITSPYLSFLYTQRKMTLFWGTLWGKEKKEEDQSRFTIFFTYKHQPSSIITSNIKPDIPDCQRFFFSTECWGFWNPNVYLGQKDTPICKNKRLEKSPHSSKSDKADIII